MTADHVSETTPRERAIALMDYLGLAHNKTDRDEIADTIRAAETAAWNAAVEACAKLTIEYIGHESELERDIRALARPVTG